MAYSEPDAPERFIFSGALLCVACEWLQILNVIYMDIIYPGTLSVCI